MRIRSVAAASLSTALLLGVVVPASAQDDPYEVLTNAVTTTATATSFHLLAEANGTVNLGEAMGNVPFAIDGTKAEGDISINPVAVSLTFEVPIQGLSISGGAIIPGDGNALASSWPCRWAPSTTCGMSCPSATSRCPAPSRPLRPPRARRPTSRPSWTRPA
ncbi:MAG: hypothetical protein R3C32_11260 [Chloroflexota bacterium]